VLPWKILEGFSLWELVDHLESQTIIQQNVEPGSRILTTRMSIKGSTLMLLQTICGGLDSSFCFILLSSQETFSLTAKNPRIISVSMDLQATSLALSEKGEKKVKKSRRKKKMHPLDASGFSTI
jgi:hypothetical protein